MTWPDILDCNMREISLKRYFPIIIQEGSSDCLTFMKMEIVGGGDVVYNGIVVTGVDGEEVAEGIHGHAASQAESVWLLNDPRII